MQSRSLQTLTIEGMLQNGQSLSAIARAVGVSRARVQQINRRWPRGLHDRGVSGGGYQGAGQVSLNPHMKSLTIRFTPAVHDALVEACQIANRQDPEEQITIADYVEQVVINNLVEMGLVRKHKRK